MRIRKPVDLRNPTVDFPCPGCGHEDPLKLESLRDGYQHTCSKCSAVSTFTGDDAKKATAALRRLGRALSELGKLGK